MAIDYDKLLALKIPDAEHSYGDKDTMLYAIGVGPGHDPTDRAPRESPPSHKVPERAPDLVCDLGTRPEMALVYRLSADLNPLHADLDVAKAAGFPRPILHGLGTFGVVGHALLKSVCNYDPSRFTAMSGRFSAPVFPGETIRTEIWRDGNVVSFRALVPERNIVAMSNGRAEIKA